MYPGRHIISVKQNQDRGAGFRNACYPSRLLDQRVLFTELAKSHMVAHFERGASRHAASVKCRRASMSEKGHLFENMSELVLWPIAFPSWSFKLVACRKGRMSELARRAWVVSVGLRQKDGVFFEYLLFYAGHPTKQSAIDAVRRHLMHRASPRIKTERELLAAEIVTKEVRYRQVRFFGKRRIKIGASNCEGS